MTSVDAKTMKMLIASMDKHNKYDTLLINKNQDPNKLRSKFNTNIHSTNNLYSYTYKQNTQKQHSYHTSLGIHNYSIFHYLNGNIYYINDIPDQIPNNPLSGITKIYAHTNDEQNIKSLSIVTFDPIKNSFQYTNVNILFHREMMQHFEDRINYTWTYSTTKNVDIYDFYTYYPIILKDFIQDPQVGVEKLIDYIKTNN